MNERDTLAPKPYGAVPSDRQLRWHGLEFYGFVHFTVNTFTDKEWGYGDESPAVFDPTDFDAGQIARVAADAGMAGLILTCKHHDGFCLWPSAHTEHSVKHSPWRHGKGDMVREFAEACRACGIRFGVYLSPWDRNHPDYGRPAYIDYYRKQLTELTTRYGDLFEVWFDGANGGDGYYGGACETRRIDRRTYYDWANTQQIVRENQPWACMFSDGGPDIRWVGNEKGIAGDPCWSTMNRERLYAGFDLDEMAVTDVETDVVKAWGSKQELLNHGERNGSGWLPAECDVSIRPGWFYHEHEDDKVRTPENLLDLYFKSVGRGASFLLNLPPDRRGRIHENDVTSLQGFRKRLDRLFAKDLARGAEARASNVRGGNAAFAASNLVDGNPDTYWCSDDADHTPEVILAFDEPVTFNVVGMRECLPLGQRVERVAVDIEKDGRWAPYADAPSIGHRRLLRGDTCTTARVRLRVEKSAACPVLSELALYADPAPPPAAAS